MAEPRTETGKRLLVALSELMPPETAEVIAAIEAEAAQRSELGDAWAEAEALLREGWYLGVQHANEDLAGQRYMAIAADMVWLTESLSGDYAYGPTPTAALRALAVMLRR